jgi:hypothetical protein
VPFRAFSGRRRSSQGNAAFQLNLASAYDAALGRTAEEREAMERYRRLQSR